MTVDLTTLHLPENSVLITDETLDALYSIPARGKILVPRGESAKSLDVAKFCWKEMHRMGLDRHSTVIALGGGSVTDLAGFVAACYMRGIDSIYIPTTLLGMVDASIGGKCGVNLDSGKSLVGAFHFPKKVHILPALLDTLPEREFRSGMAEVIKYGVIWDSALFEQLETKGMSEEMIYRCGAIKSEIVEQDEREKGLRAILNYGHTFGHALEVETGYQRFLHGEAVAIGMSLAMRLSVAIGWTDAAAEERQRALLQKFGLPTELPEDIDVERLVSHMEGDKKCLSGKIHLILVKEIGKVSYYINKDTEILKEFMAALQG